MFPEELLQVIEKAAQEESTELDLSGQNIRALPPEIGKLIHLKKLILGKFQYDEQGYITDIIGNNLSVLPVEIGELIYLEELHLVSNHFSSLPKDVSKLTNLRLLDLSFNKLSALPGEVTQLSNLQSLNLSSNRLSSLLPSFVRFSNLRSLDLRSNKLNSLTLETTQLSNLQSLYLSDNKLSSLPAQITELSNLQELYLSHNNLSSLPPEFGQLSNLQELCLSHNNLSSLPPEFGQLTNLQQLYLSHNNLSSLPLTIKNLQKLEKLDIRGNPVPIPPEILSSKNFIEAPGDVSEILDFYFRVQDPNETEQLYEAKLLIVGEGGAGKTSLAKKIQDENYQLQASEKFTQGIDVIKWDFQLPNGKEFRVNIWDFGGQEIYHQTHQFFLTKRSLYALVADDRKENTDFYWWLKVVELLSDNSPVIIVKNEKQDRSCEVNERQLRGEFTNLKEIFPTNLATNRGLSQVKDFISHYMTRLDHVNIPLPKIWVRVRSALENDSRNYISVEQYYQLCTVNGLSDRQDMLRLSGYLHDLGVCLHFQDDSILKHQVILKPEWGTDAVYKVLDNKSVQQNLGRFSDSDLARIWGDSKYADMRDQLLELMIRFKLCYPLRKNLDDRYPKNYIAPQLLNPNQPHYTWDNEHNLILRYKYEFMPKGILSRFIVETHPWIEQQRLVWRSGVVLNKNDTRAEIIENYNLKEIKVRVTGNRKKELLAVITHELDKIHSSFERLRYTTLVPCNCSQCQGNQQPYSYPLENLHRRLTAGQYQIQCEISYEMVDVRRLIDDVNLPPGRENQESYSMPTPLQSQLESEKEQSYITINLYNELSNKQATNDNSGNTANTTISGGTIHGGIQTSQGNRNSQTQENPVTHNHTTHMGDGNYNESIEGNYVQGDYFAAAANEIQSLLQQLEQSNSTNTTAGKMAIATLAIEQIDHNPTLAALIFSALKAGGTQALAQLLNHPAASFFIGALEDWYNTHQDK